MKHWPTLGSREQGRGEGLTLRGLVTQHGGLGAVGVEVSYVGGAQGLAGLGAGGGAAVLGLVGVRQRALVTGLVCRGEAAHSFGFL